MPPQPHGPEPLPASPPHPMDSRRLVVWISAGILGFQCGTLLLDLSQCSLLSWLYVQRYGLSQSAPGSAPTRAAQLPHQRRISPTGPDDRAPVDPTALFCDRPRSRIDAAVSQGLSILAGLALGGTVGSRDRDGF